MVHELSRLCSSTLELEDQQVAEGPKRASKKAAVKEVRFVIMHNASLICKGVVMSSFNIQIGTESQNGCYGLFYGYAFKQCVERSS